MTQPRRLTSDMALTVLLARQGLRDALRRNGLGPFWNTLGTLVVVGTVGLLFGTILKRQLDSFEGYVSSLAAGLVVWGFLAGVANENASAFLRWKTVFRHSALTLPVLSGSILARHLAVLAVNTVLLVLLHRWLVAAPHTPAVVGNAAGGDTGGDLPAILSGLAAMALVILNGAWIGALALVLGARFRDVGQLIAKALQLAFLLTPILWPPYFLGRYDYLLAFNPFYYPLAVYTAAVTHTPAAPWLWLAATLLALVGTLGTARLLSWSRPRLYVWI